MEPALTSRSSLRGMWLVVHAWGTIAAAIALVALWPNPLTWLIAVMIVGNAPARPRDPDARSRPSAGFIGNKAIQ